MVKPVLVLGGTGMLGSAVIDSLAARGSAVTATTRRAGAVSQSAEELTFDASTDDLGVVVAGYGPGDVVVNCVGVIKPYIDDGDATSRERAIAINASLPYRLAALAEAQGFHVVQIATDCVFAGDRGGYSESEPHDALDVYGKSKSLGEVPSSQFLNLRCSIIGTEPSSAVSLLEWVLSHDAGSSLTGYTNHRWNGVTAQAFGRVVAGIVERGEPRSGTTHLVPSDEVTKAELCQIILDAYRRSDVTVELTAPEPGIDRTLTTLFPDANAELWAGAGYDEIPSIASLVHDLAGASREGVSS